MLHSTYHGEAGPGEARLGVAGTAWRGEAWQGSRRRVVARLRFI